MGLISAAVLHFWPQPATSLHDPNRHATKPQRINIKYETAETPPDRYGPPMVGKFFFLMLESTISGLILACVLHFRPRPINRRHVHHRHKTLNAPSKHRIRHQRNANGSPRIGKYFFLRLGSAIFGLILAAVLHFWPQPATRRHDPRIRGGP